jgi:hypothetical protein
MQHIPFTRSLGRSRLSPVTATRQTTPAYTEMCLAILDSCQCRCDLSNAMARTSRKCATGGEAEMRLPMSRSASATATMYPTAHKQQEAGDDKVVSFPNKKKCKLVSWLFLPHKKHGCRLPHGLNKAGFAMAGSQHDMAAPAPTTPLRTQSSRGVTA